jgi:hypothetical protein
MTRLSGWLPSLLALVPLVTGCLVDDPPAYRAPQRTPPRIGGPRVLPRLDEIITYRADANQPLVFTIPISSEDVGDQVEGRLYSDYLDAQSNIRRVEKIPASTLDEGERILKMDWTPGNDLAPGCHRITLRVTHAANWRSNAAVYDPADVDEVYWFAKINVDDTRLPTLVDCPDASNVR